jgi:hypothetical protein
MTAAIPHTLTRLLACAAPPLWFAGLLAILSMQSLPLGLFLMPCVAFFLFSAVAAWRATRIGTEANTVGMSTQIGLHLGGVWVIPYAMIALLTLMGYERLLPAYLAMLLPALAYAVWPGDVRRFGLALGVGLLLAAIATWATLLQHLPGPIIPRLTMTLETVMGCTFAAMPIWTLFAYYRLVRHHQTASRLVNVVVVIATVAVLASAYALLLIGMSGMTD